VVVAVAALPILAVFAAYNAWSGGPIDPDLNPANAIFANRIVVGIIRIAIIVAAIFAIVSMVVAAVRGQFLLQVGPVRLSESVRGAAADRDRLAADLAQAGQAIASLERELEDTASALERTGDDLQLALDYIARLEPPEKDGTDARKA
jgi:septal ring factor EnvC (AmiA/AmiB activator)